ncbi:TniQ family protein [Rhizobium sullae]|uniref:TniQ protein n=1 Tax=Rhizobium sullae TaxID=50338 RepID=A0A4R3QI59_RHISU|nr:TniQ family protein [Rhizobium sullae]TCU17906.1 TniQ protein [Rhizobium sullae]
MKLPVNATFHPDTETPLSLASRLARAMGYSSVADLLGGTTVQAVARGDHDAVRILSSWSGVPAEKLQRFAVPATEEAGEWRLGDAVFRKEMRVAGRFRFCPHCLVEDLELGSGRPQARPHERASWLTRAVTACTRHRELLVEAEDGAPASDVALFVAEGWHLKCQPGAPADEAELEVDAYLERRIAGNRTQSFIDRQEVHVVLMLFHFLGWIVHNHLPSFRIGGVMAATMGVRALGFRIASEGREAIETLVTEAVDLHRPAAHTIMEFFGPMVRHLRRNVDAPAYAEIIGLFQDLVERYVPVGPGDRFVHPVERRQLHSVRSAAIDYSMDPQRIRKLLEERGIILQSKFSDRRVYFSVEDGDNILAGATENMTTVEAAVALGTTDNRVRDIIGRGLLAVSERGVEANRPYYRVGKADLDDFRNRLFKHASVAGRGHDLVPLSAACRRRSLTLTDIVEMLLDGKLTRVARADDKMMLGSLLIDLQEVPVSAAGNHGQDDEGRDGIYLNLTEVKNALLTTDVTVAALVKHAVLPVEMRTNPRTRRKQPFVHRRSIDAFLDGHRSLYGIARGWRRNIAWMKDELDQNGMKPIFETSGKIARYYRKEDLAKASLLPPNA